MYVAEFTDGTTLACTDYEETDTGVEFAGRDDETVAFAPFHSVRYVYRADAPESPPRDGHRRDGYGSGDGDGSGDDDNRGGDADNRGGDADNDNNADRSCREGDDNSCDGDGCTAWRSTCPGASASGA